MQEEGRLIFENNYNYDIREIKIFYRNMQNSEGCLILGMQEGRDMMQVMRLNWVMAWTSVGFASK